MPLAAVALSDLHLGAPHSTLNLTVPYTGHPNAQHGRPARNSLLAHLRALSGGERIDRLIILGDAIDLSHGSFPVAVAEFDTLLGEILGAETVGEVVFVPGNHDRQWWQLQCEHDGLVAPMLAGNAPADRNAFRRTTPTGGRIDALVVRNALPSLGATPMRVAYPDYAFVANGIAVRVHHGHLFGDLYSMVTHLLENARVDLETRAVRRDPQQSPTSEQARMLEAADDLFGFGLDETLEGATTVQDIELYERLNAPLVNLDWLLLGQTGLLDHSHIGGDIMRFQSEAPATTGAERTRAEEAGTGLARVLGLAALDRLSPVQRLGGLHSYSNSVAGTFLAQMLRGIVRSAMNPPRQPSDDSPTTLHRGSTIADNAPAIWDYLDRFAGGLPSVLIVGHTHVAGQQSLQRTGDAAVDTVNVFNTGSWVSGGQIPQPQRHVCVVRTDGSVQIGPVP